MKALEHKAEKYDSGMDTLTRGRLAMIKEYIADCLVLSGDRLLDIGMGTGTFAIAAAKKGALVTGIDTSEKMLEVARKNLAAQDLTEKVTVIHASVVELDQQFNDSGFNKITSILVFSELYLKEREFCLDQVFRLLKEDGEFILVDEVRPRKFWKRVAFYLIRIPLAIVTYLRAQLTTRPLAHMIDMVKERGFEVMEERLYLLDTLQMLRLRKAEVSGSA
jgi:cyclopropane fatty-acyl-phospholipid synthase-like methyltransferase